MAYNKKWLILPTSVTASIDFGQVSESSIDTLRISLDNTKTFVKYETNTITASYSESFWNPVTQETEYFIIEAGVYGRPNIYPQGLGEYNYDQIIEILSSNEWTPPPTE